MVKIWEEHKRSMLKSISWRIIATSTTMFLVFILTRKLVVTIVVGTAEFSLKMIFYFLHERGWNRINFGRSLAEPRSIHKNVNGRQEH